jgi:glycosyltransferase involved in cell wall biosynthesis
LDVTISVIVTTYNRPDALNLVLRGLAAQDTGDFEVLVADDGSTPETASAIAALRPGVP